MGRDRLWVFGERHKEVRLFKEFEPNARSHFCSNCAFTQFNLPNPTIISQVAEILICFLKG